MNPYQKLLNRKRKWSPVQTTAGKLADGAEETIYRALAIRHMELPVGDFISDALKNEVPEHLKQFIKSYDLRPNKNRYDDIVFTIDKSNNLV